MDEPKVSAEQHEVITTAEALAELQLASGQETSAANLVQSLAQIFAPQLLKCRYRK